jgi:CDP-glycerol glycerophosphotransferase (TagB/SpsB family)
MLLIPKQHNLILFGSWFGNKYADNTKYMYEYLLSREDLEIYWYTKNKEIYNKLKEEGKPVVLSSQPKAIWKQIRARMLISTVQVAEFNNFFLSNCVYLDLGHGSPIKDSGFDMYNYCYPELQTTKDKKSIAYLQLIRKHIDYYMVVASDEIEKIIQKAFHVHQGNTLNLGKPRNDVFYDKILRKGINTNIDDIKGDRKAIVYMPTHRSGGTHGPGGSIKMQMEELLDLPRIQNICKKYNHVFLIKKHYYHRHENENLSKYPNIYDITNEDIDSQVLLYQADALITDYSACYIDYLLLNRPIIFYPYDLEYFLKNERNMYIPYDEITVGPKTGNREELTQFIEDLCRENQDEFEQDRMKLRDFYYSKHNQQCVRDQIAKFIYRVVKDKH